MNSTIHIYRRILQYSVMIFSLSMLMCTSCSTEENSLPKGDHVSVCFPYGGGVSELRVGGYEAEYDIELVAGAGSGYLIEIEQQEPSWCWTSRQTKATEKSGVLALNRRVEKIYLASNMTVEPRVATIRVTIDEMPPVVLTLTQGVFDRPSLFYKPWAELPDYAPSENRITVTHYADIASGKRVRNYSLCFDTELGYAVWCAYPIHKCYMSGTYHRTDDWQYDPKIPIEYQTNLSLGSYRNSWVRGHQVMSNHRYVSYSDELNAQTFYSTNIMPQHYDFNGGLWNDVEGACTKQACADTLYCVTGAWGSQGTTTDKAGKRITIPSHCYKAMLRTRSGSTGKSIDQITDPSQLKAIAYWAPNSADGNKGSASEYMISVAELEQKIGIRLFPMLDSSVEQAVKSQCNAAEWGIR